MPLFPQALKERFRKIIKDYPTDFFLRKEVIYRKKDNNVLPNRYGNKEINQYTDFNVFTLQVTDKEKSNVSKDNDTGAFDDTKSYFLFNLDDLELVGLFVDNKPNMTPNLDYIIKDSTTYEVIGVQSLGQLVDKDVLVKVWVRQLVNDL